VAAGGAQKPLGIEHLHVPVLRSAGEPIDLRFRLDANKVLTVTAELANHKDAHCTVRLENPLCAVAFGSERQKEIAELEQALRLPAPAHFESARREQLADLYMEEGQFERAIDHARHVMEADRRPSEGLLNLTARCYKHLGAVDRAEKFYREAVRVAPGSPISRFNLSLLLEQQNRIDEAMASAEECVKLDPGEGVYRGWRAILWQRQRRGTEAREELQRAAEMLDAPPSRDPWQRYWRYRVAEALGDAVTAARLARESSQQPAQTQAPGYDESRLPGHTGALARRVS
jgi:tetratricopeptide (TPR) repeat protein